MMRNKLRSKRKINIFGHITKNLQLTNELKNKLKGKNLKKSKRTKSCISPPSISVHNM